MAHWPDVKLHLYGKGFRPGRKVGHVTALGTDLAVVRERARAAAAYLSLGDATGLDVHTGDVQPAVSLRASTAATIETR